MYLDLFQLNALPFRLSPDPAFLYLSPRHAAVAEQLQAALQRPAGILVLTGETGAGKTIVIERFLADLPPRVVVARLNQTQVTALGFLQGLLVQFGFAPFSMNRAQMLATIDAFLLEQQSADRSVLLIIDEAQHLGQEVLEEIGRLAQPHGPDARRSLCIVLAGQPPLADLLEAPALAAVAAEVCGRLQLTALPAVEAAAYIQHRLDVAGANGHALFDASALELVQRYAGGMPRLVNTLCDTALMNAYEQHLECVGADQVQAAIDSLQWVEYAARIPPRHRPAPAAAVAPQLPQSSLDAPVGYLQVSLEGRVVAALALRCGRVLIGRTSENDLQIDSTFVSRHHCQISVSPGSAIIEDLNSTNGLLLKGERVRRHTLADGDIVIIGQHSLTYQAVPAEDPSP